MNQLVVARYLIVPREAFAAVTDLTDPAGIVDPAKRLRLTPVRARAIPSRTNSRGHFSDSPRFF